MNFQKWLNKHPRDGSEIAPWTRKELIAVWAGSALAAAAITWTAMEIADYELFREEPEQSVAEEVRPSP